jgi:thioredoxin-like negative regulator of GroEL
VVKSLLAQALMHGCASSRLERFFVETPSQDDDSLADELPAWLELFRNRSLASSHSPQRMADTVTEFTCQIAGKGTDCFRVKIQHKLYPEFVWTAFVVRHEQTLRLCRRGINDCRIGQRALDLLTDGRQDDARRWLEWVYDRQRKELGWFDQFQGSPFARLWLAGGKHEQAKDLELATAALATTSDAAAKCIAILSAGRGELAPILQLQVDRALANGYHQLGDDHELVKITNAMGKTHPRAIEPAMLHLHALARSQDIEAIRQFVDQPTGSDELQIWGQLMLSAALTATGNMEEAADLLTELRHRDNRLSGYLLTYVVWLSLFQDPLPEGMVALAAESLKQAELAGLEDRIEAQQRSQAIYTLALIEAGQLSAAIEALHSMPAVDAESRPDRLDHYVLGRIAEACGFPEQAMMHFKQVTPFEPHQPNSLYDLAQQRLAPLGNKLRKYGKLADSR